MMRILIANKFYYPRGGDCVYTIELERLLKRKGHDVAIFSMHHEENLNNDYSEFWVSNIDFNDINSKNLLKAPLRPIFSFEVREKFSRLLDYFKPDIVHLNNIHSQISPLIATISYQKHIPVVWTLHDYKLICPNYVLFQHDKVCDECLKNKYNVIKNKCIKNNLFASLLAYLENVKWNKKILEKVTDRFIAPSKFLKYKMIQGGFSSVKIEQIYNFVPSSKLNKDLVIKNHLYSNYYIYFGRLSREKGLITLLDAAIKNSKYELRIFGTGPMEYELKNKYSSYPNIKFEGHKPWNILKNALLNAKFFIIPSEWYENNPLSIIEAFSFGLPGIGSNIGGIPELIKNNFNGFLFESGNTFELLNKINELFTHKNYIKFVQNAYIFSKQFNEENYYDKIFHIYSSLVKKGQ